LISPVIRTVSIYLFAEKDSILSSGLAWLSFLKSLLYYIVPAGIKYSFIINDDIVKIKPSIKI
jgi:hypothetical protein